MGNYYEGSLCLPVKKDIPLDILSTLLSIPDSSDKPMHYIADKFKGMKMFDKGKYKPIVEVYIRFTTEAEEPGYIHMFSNSLYEIDECKNSGHEIEGFDINLAFLCKTGWEEFYKDLAESWFNILQDYIDIEYIENKNVLTPSDVYKVTYKFGEVHDEDGYYDMAFVLNENKEPEIIKFIY